MKRDTWDGIVQGDHSACSKPPVDIDLKVALKYKDLTVTRQKIVFLATFDNNFVH